MPTAASTSASAANAPSRTAMKRCSDSARAVTCSIVRISESGRFGSRFRTNDHAFGVAVRQRPNQHGLDEAEDGGIRADAERGRDNRDRREGGPGNQARRTSRRSAIMQSDWTGPEVAKVGTPSRKVDRTTCGALTCYVLSATCHVRRAACESARLLRALRQS